MTRPKYNVLSLLFCVIVASASSACSGPAAAVSAPATMYLNPAMVETLQHIGLLNISDFRKQVLASVTDSAVSIGGMQLTGTRTKLAQAFAGNKPSFIANTSIAKLWDANGFKPEEGIIHGDFLNALRASMQKSSGLALDDGAAPAATTPAAGSLPQSTSPFAAEWNGNSYNEQVTTTIQGGGHPQTTVQTVKGSMASNQDKCALASQALADANLGTIAGGGCATGSGAQWHFTDNSGTLDSTQSCSGAAQIWANLQAGHDPNVPDIASQVQNCGYGSNNSYTLPQ